MKKIFYLIALLSVFTACNDDNNEDKDTQMPVITDDGIQAVPSDCQSFQRGDTIHFFYIFKDNNCLGKYNLEIHNNFNHHTHSTSSVECDKEDNKQPVNPWVYNQDFDIPSGLKIFNAQTDIAVPEDIDCGEYHFMIRLTDRAGWQQLRSAAIRITE